MRRIRWRLIACALLLSVAVPGCGGCMAREAGKNSDLDRPKPAGKVPDKK